jgi:hypothetical protein
MAHMQPRYTLHTVSSSVSAAPGAALLPESCTLMGWQWGQEAVLLSFWTALGDRTWYSWPGEETRTVSARACEDAQV